MPRFTPPHPEDYSHYTLEVLREMRACELDFIASAEQRLQAIMGAIAIQGQSVASQIIEIHDHINEETV